MNFFQWFIFCNISFIDINISKKRKCKSVHFAKQNVTIIYIFHIIYIFRNHILCNITQMINYKMMRLKNRKTCEFSHDHGSMNVIFTKLQNDYMAGNFQSHRKNREILNFSRVTATRNNKIFLIDSVRAARSWIIAFIWISIKIISFFATYYFGYYL